MMRCHEVKKLVSRRLEHSLGADDTATLVGHLEACADCRAFAREMALLGDLLAPDPEIPCDEWAAGVVARIERRGPAWLAAWYRPLVTCVGALFFASGVMMGAAMLDPAAQPSPMSIPNPFQTLARQFDAFDESSPSGRLLALWTPVEDKP